MAGKRLGLLDQPLVHAAVEDLAAGRESRERLLAACRDERSLLAAEPMRYLYALNTVGEPDWVAMEEVPHVLPLWKQYAAVLRGWGFSVVGDHVIPHDLHDQRHVIPHPRGHDSPPGH
jgi:DNA (cytosine-5)-methyltransferase 1